MSDKSDVAMMLAYQRDKAIEENNRLRARNAKLERVRMAAQAWATESRDDLGHDKLNLTWLVQELSACDSEKVE